MTGRKVRTKKLGVKTPLPVLRESEIDQTEYHALITENQIATGVEQAEENEFHLQTILKGAGTSNDQEIPVPPPQLSDVVYEVLYGTIWEEPKSYIRSSATVEECIDGAAYDMTREDDEFLTKYNAALAAASRLSEDNFEAIMDVFENTASEQTPYASVDNTVIAYEHMVPTLAILNSPVIMQHAQAVYDYWRSRRKELGNRPLHPTLKFEVHQETDESDPYVCFRRREARQTRKTRARDVQMTEKLKRLRRELEDGRQLIIDTFERETLKRTYLNMDRDVFEQRARLKEMKVRLGIRTEDEDLYNHKPPKRKAPEPPAPSRLQLRLPARPDPRAVESDLVLLLDKQAEKENMLQQEIERMALSHKVSNQNYVDLSLAPLSPLREQFAECKFRAARASEYLMTPPTSASEAMDLDDEDDGNANANAHPRIVQFSAGGHSPVHMPRYRRRIGRGGRMWIDRRDMAGRPCRPEGSRAADQWRFDGNDDDDEPPVYELDPYSDAAMLWRTMTIGVPRPMHHMGARRPPPANAASVAEASATYQRAMAAGDDDASRQARQPPSQQANGSGPSGSHTRAALVPAPMQAQNGTRQLSKMAPPVLPPAQKV